MSSLIKLDRLILPYLILEFNPLEFLNWFYLVLWMNSNKSQSRLKNENPKNSERIPPIWETIPGVSYTNISSVTVFSWFLYIRIKSTDAFFLPANGLPLISCTSELKLRDFFIFKQFVTFLLANAWNVSKDWIIFIGFLLLT